MMEKCTFSLPHARIPCPRKGSIRVSFSIVFWGFDLGICCCPLIDNVHKFHGAVILEVTTVDERF